MLLHYLTLSLRTLRRAPFLTLTKLLVLTLGLCCFVVAYALVSYWRHAERGFAKADRTYATTTRIQLSDGSDTTSPRLDNNFYEKLKIAFPELEALARAHGGGLVPLSAGDRKVRMFGSYADDQFLAVFDLPFVAGDARHALDQPNSAVLTQDAARRLFGTPNALGRTFRFAGVADVTVTGVIGAISQPSHLGPSPTALLRFDALASWDVHDRVMQARNATGTGSPYPQLGYAVLPAGSRETPATLAPRLAPIGELTIERDLVHFTIGMQPVRELVAQELDRALFAGTHTSLTVSTLLLMLGALVLVVACVNYVNLATAQALKRAREVGLRKAIGAEPRQIAAQHLLEAALMTSAALVVATALVALAAPALRTTANVDVTLAFADARFWLVALGAAAAATLLAGTYPALVLARVRPLWALTSRDARGGRGAMSALLVGVQFAAASFLLIAIFVMQQQATDLRRTGLAASDDPLVVVTNTSAYTSVDSASLEEQLRSLLQVKSVGAMSNPLWTDDNHGTTLMTNPRDAASLKSALTTGVDYDFFATMRTRLIAGRTFDRSRADTSMWNFDFNHPASLVIDETFARVLGFADPRDALDTMLYLPVAAQFQPLQVIGVVEDQPLLFAGNGMSGTIYHLADRPSELLIRLDKNDVAAGLGAVQRVWEKRVPDHPFDYEFEDQLFARGYRAFARVSEAFAGLASLAYLICVVGLVGMAGHVTSRRRREIGVRKSFGASTRSVLALLLVAFSKPVIVANVVAWPFAYLAMKAYLTIFVHRVPLTPTPFAASLVATVLIAWASVAVQAWRAARVQPASVLRNE